MEREDVVTVVKPLVAHFVREFSDRVDYLRLVDDIADEMMKAFEKEKTNGT